MSETIKQQADAAYTLEQLLEGKREVRTKATFADWIFAATDEKAAKAAARREKAEEYASLLQLKLEF